MSARCGNIKLEISISIHDKITFLLRSIYIENISITLFSKHLHYFEINEILILLLTSFLQDGATPLMFAAQNGHNEAVKILVQHGAGVDMQDMVSTLYSDILLP